MNKVFISVLMLITFLISCVILLYILAAQHVEIKDKDLIYYPQKIDDDKNAYIALLPALRQIRDQKLHTETESLPKNEKEIEIEVARELVNKYSSILTVFSKALTLDSFQALLKQSSKEDGSESFSKELLFLHNLAYLNIMVLLDEGDLNSAEREIEKLIKYGHFLQNSDGGVVYALIGTLVKNRSLDLLQKWTFKSSFDASNYGHLIEIIETYSDNSGIANSLKTDYTSTAPMLKNLIEDNIKNDPENKALLEKYKKNPERSRFLYNKNATVNEIADHYRQEINNLRGSYSDVKHKDNNSNSFHFSYYLSLLSGNPIGKIILEIGKPSFRTIIEKKFKLDAKFNLTKLLLAIKVYYADKGGLPSTLEELAPKYINKIPPDPFDNKNLKYSKEVRIIYSIDSDMRDDLGNKEKDICLLLEF